MKGKVGSGEVTTEVRGKVVCGNVTTNDVECDEPKEVAACDEPRDALA